MVFWLCSSAAMRSLLSFLGCSEVTTLSDGVLVS
jgi:hypothetical protein